MNEEHCAYLGKDTDRKKNNHPVFDCLLHEQCTLHHCDDQTSSCDRCRDSLKLSDEDFASKWVDPLPVTTRYRQPTTHLRNILAGGGAFLIGGGPSANQLPLEDLNRKGVFSLGVNNVAAHPRFRPQAFVCSDPPKKFSHCIWFDPQIMKFVPKPKLSGIRSKLRRKLKDGSFEYLKERVYDCPNVWGFQRSSWLTPDNSFFTEPGAMWGNHNAGVKRTGEEKTVCTLLLGLRILYYLGARRIYLVGVDFWMRPDHGYSFNQGRDEGACESNNRQFGVVNDWMVRMVANGVFEQFGLEVCNCYANSGLRAFPYLPFDQAIIDCKGICDDSPDLSDWYSKDEKDKGKKK